MQQGVQRMDLIAGVALGALVGTLVGLSSVPVVGAVVTALVALLVAFFGLQGSAGPLKANASAARVAGFGGGMLLFVVLGVLARAGGWLQPGIETRVLHYEAAGYAAPLARDIALYEHTGLLTGTLKDNKPEATPPRGAGLLFSDEADPNCAVLSASMFQSPEARLQAMQQSGGAWQTVGEAAAGLAPAKGSALAEAAWQLACRPSD